MTIKNSAQSSDAVDTVVVWDRFIRIFHWSLGLLMITAYFSATYHFMEVHEIAGYLLCVLIPLRLLWGFIGTTYARFSNFLFSPRTTLAYFVKIVTNQPGHYLGHNPAGAVMVYVLLASIITLLLTGLMTLSCIDIEGPLQAFAYSISDTKCFQNQSFHESFGNFFWWFIAAHLAGVISASFQHKENLAKSMLTGRKQRPSSQSL